jgi:hypothetical protein
MEAGIRDLDGGVVEVVYEHALHEVTRERLAPEAAVRLLLAVLDRDQFGRVEVTHDGPVP